METLVVLATAVVLLVGMPLLIVRMMRRERHKRRDRPSGMGFEGAFDVFDPARARAHRIIEVQQEVGRLSEGDQGERIDAKDAGRE